MNRQTSQAYYGDDVPAASVVEQDESTIHMRPPAKTLVEMLRREAELDDQALGFTLLGEHNAIKEHISYGELDRRARVFAARLVEHGQDGDRILLAYPFGIDFMSAFFGCLYARRIAVPIAVTLPWGVSASRIAGIAKDSGASFALCTEEYNGARDPEAGPLLQQLSWLVEDGRSGQALAAPRPVSPHDIAFLQYTSGSTRDPKGVIIGHDNVMANLAMINQAYDQRPGNVTLTWLPMYHDMGLIGSMLSSIHASMRCILLPTMHAIRRPLRWLQALSTYRATHTAAPDFAYAWAVSRTTEAQRQGLDLSCVRSAVCGAEPVRKASIEAFLAAFVPHGFPRPAIRPSYGLAEACVFVSADDTGPHFVSFQSGSIESGRPQPAQDGPRRELVRLGVARRFGVFIADCNTGHPVADGVVGEIRVQGAHVARGYFQNLEATDAVFRAAAPPLGLALRTGDLGFIYEGQLYVSGRLKDLIIVRGKNHDPAEIELTVEEAAPALRSHGAAAFSVDAEAGERLAVVAELGSGHAPATAELEALFATVRKAVAEKHGLHLYTLVLVRNNSLPRTTSGKIRRHACRLALERGELKEQGRSERDEPPEPPTQAEVPVDSLPLAPPKAQLVALLAEVLELRPSEVPSGQALGTLGLDSIKALDLKTRLEDELGVSVSLQELFSHLTLEMLAHKVAQIARPDKAAPNLAVIPDIEHRYDPFPMTELQRALRLGEKEGLPLGGISYLYYGEFDREAEGLAELEAAWNATVQRHDMLRAVLSDAGTQQVLREVPPYRFVRNDLRSLGAAEQVQALAATRARLGATRFDATRWPLFVIEVSELSAQRVRLHLCISLLVCDGMSLRIALNDFGALYKGRAPLVPLQLRFRDYQLACQRPLYSEARQRARDYWMAKLDRLPPAPALPLCRPLGELRADAQRERLGLRLPPTAWQALRERAGRAGLTPSAVLCAAFADVLAGFSEQPDFTLNLTLFSRRPLHAEVNRIVGELATVVLLDLRHRAASFVERAAALQGQLLENLEHKDFTGISVLGELSQRGGIVLMPVVFTSMLGHPVQGDEEFGGWLGQPVYTATKTPQVLIDHIVVEHQGALIASWDVVSAAFPPGFCQAMFSAYEALITHLAMDADAFQNPRLRLLPAAQRIVREAVNATDAPISPRLVHDLFFEHCQATPEQVAVVSTDGRLSYGALCRRAAAVARALLEADCDPDAPVAVVLPKGLGQVVAMFGILLAGKAAMPVQFDAPPARTQSLLEQAGVRQVLAATTSLEVPAGVRVFAIDALGEADPLGAFPRPSQDAPACLIYTSGSTGTPKGVVLSHRSLVNVLDATGRRFGCGPWTVALGLTPLYHDLALYDIFGVLGVGGRLVLPDPLRLRDPAHWLELMEQEGVSFWNSVPAMMEMLVVHAEGLGRPLPQSLRLVILGGDWIPVSLPERLRALVPAVEIVSVGGPTETTIWSIWHPVGPRDLDWPSIPYGRPIPNLRYYILDERLEDRPDWVPGTMWCAGAGLSSGYFRDPQRTAAVFRFHPDTGERIYNTGDRGRYRPDGTIEFLGRTDLQVKIRGVRIELGEIEAALESHPFLRRAVVVAQGAKGSNERFLAAFVVPIDEARAATREALSFKLERRGLRRFAADASGVALPAETMPAPITRVSQRTFLADPVPLDTVARLLAALRAHTQPQKPLPRHRYPSGGGLYPVQTYLHARRVEGLSAGAYYYDPDGHRLVAVQPGAELDFKLHVPHNRSLVKEAAFSLFLFADLDAIEPLYGGQARDLCLLEAGYMGQLLAESAATLRLGLCPIGGLDTGPLGPLFALGPRHVYLHSFEGGLPDLTREAPSPQAAFIDAVREHAAARLPTSMMPARFIVVEALPLSENGKVDRKALAAELDPIDLHDFQAPATELESKIAALFSRELGLPRLGVTSNLFTVGASSVHLVAVAAALSAEFGQMVPATALFERPTIRELAGWLEGIKAPEDPMEKARAQGEQRRNRRRLGRER